MTAVRFIRDRDEPDIFWIATWGGGLEKFDRRRETFTHHQHDPEDPQSISSNTVYDVMQDSRGNLLGQHRQGASTNSTSRPESSNGSTKASGFDAKIVHNMLEDRSGRLWMGPISAWWCSTSTANRSSRSTPPKTACTATTFSPPRAARHAMGSCGSGDSTDSTVSIRKICKRTRTPPQIYLTAIKQGGEAIKPPTAFEYLREINLGWRENFFEFEYVALNYTIAGKNRYRYKLEGLDRDWVQAGKQRTGRYSGLRGGTYTLRINGTNNDGVWNTPEQEVRLEVNVQSPPWLRWWAWMLYALSGGLFFYGFVRWRLSVSERQRVLLQEEVDARTVELRETEEKSRLLTDKNGIH